jgi:hypothetical protein
MSTRQLRKLQRQKELQTENAVPKSEEENDVSSDDDLAPAPPKPRVSLFAALGGDGDEEDEDEREESEAEAQTQEDLKDPETSQQASEAKKSKKKKKKKAKKKQVAEATAAPAVEDDEEDDIDKALKELKMNAQKSGAATEAGDQTTSRVGSLLNINPYHLKAMNEMRNMFGREAMESADAEEEQDQMRRRRGPIQQQVDLETFLRERPGAPKLPEVTLRRNIFIQGRDHWPRDSAGGLTMKEIRKAPDGSWTEYAYAYEKQYEVVQNTFHVSVSTGDPMRLVHLLKQHPYHISTLLQVSNVAKQDQNMALASELCERALFTFGRLATSSFRQNLELGRARLDFSRPENREFWLAGFRYLLSLIRKGTYRTALEWAKVMFSLDHKDPYGVRFYIHALAIKSRESGWLIDFLAFLQESPEGYEATDYILQTVVLAKLQLGNAEGAKQELIHGMQKLPWLYCELFQELNLDAPPSVWGIKADGDSRAFWIKLYVSKTKDLWNNTQATTLLRTVASELPRVNTADLPTDDQAPDLAAARLAYLEGDTGLLALVPRKLLDRQPNYDSDPLPPDEGDNVFSSESTRLPWVLARGHGGLEGLLLHQHRQGRQEPVMPGAGPGGAWAEDEELLDDEELNRELEEHMGRGGDASMYESVMQLLGMLGLGTTGAARGPDDNAPDVPQDNASDAGDRGLPGAWPEDNADDDDDVGREGNAGHGQQPGPGN